MVAIEEVDHSISFKFKIYLRWRENRVIYQNLKKNSTNNLLRQGEVRMLWLPLVIYWNTDQDETTRLGENWEWKTNVLVHREGKPKSNELTDVDEAEIFQGSENSLIMEQTYTHAFQCVFKLSKYTFDTQVSTYTVLKFGITFSSAHHCDYKIKIILKVCTIEMVLGSTDASSVKLVADELLNAAAK